MTFWRAPGPSLATLTPAFCENCRNDWPRIEDATVDLVSGWAEWECPATPCGGNNVTVLNLEDTDV